VEGFSTVEIVVSTLLSVPVGILTSFLFWWVLARRLAPRVAWSTAIILPAETAMTGSDHDQPRIKIVNVGRRDAIDLQIAAQLRLPHQVDHIGSPMSIVDVPTSVPWLPRLRRRSFRYVRLCLNQVPENEQTRVALAGEESGLGTDMLDILQRWPGAAVRFYLFAYDSFSGARKIFVSPDYGLDRVVRGAFRPGPSLEAVPAPAAPESGSPTAITAAFPDRMTMQGRCGHCGSLYALDQRVPVLPSTAAEAGVPEFSVDEAEAGLP